MLQLTAFFPSLKSFFLSWEDAVDAITEKESTQKRRLIVLPFCKDILFLVERMEPAFIINQF